MYKNNGKKYVKSEDDKKNLFENNQWTNDSRQQGLSIEEMNAFVYLIYKQQEIFCKQRNK